MNYFIDRFLVGNQSSEDSYWITRQVFVRGLGFIYFVAFLIIINQGVALLGFNGLLPIESYVKRVQSYFGGPWAAFFDLPSLFYFAHSDLSLQMVGWLGLLFSLFLLCGFANFSSIAIQLGGIGGLAPNRRPDIARLGLRAVLGGTLATMMTATIAGVLTSFAV